MNTLPQRVQDQLRAADALEAADQAARALASAPAADLIVAPVQAPSATSPQAPAPVAQAPAPEGFEQKYKTLQGMYNADVTQLRGTLKALNEQVQALSRAKEAPATPPTPAVDPQDIARFGDEMMEMVQRYVTGAVTALEARIAGLEASVTGVTQQAAQSAEQVFYARLLELVPDWRAVNVSPEWLAWLGVEDPVYGVARQAGLDNAFQGLNVTRVAAVFNAFKASQPAVTAPPSLENQLTPDGAGNSPPPSSQPKPIYTSKAITDFYNKLGRGEFAGREAEADAIEAQINQAVAEGRVR